MDDESGDDDRDELTRHLALTAFISTVIVVSQ